MKSEKQTTCKTTLTDETCSYQTKAFPLLIQTQDSEIPFISLPKGSWYEGTGHPLGGQFLLQA